jgi:hypothetical protein
LSTRPTGLELALSVSSIEAVCVDHQELGIPYDVCAEI